MDYRCNELRPGIGFAHCYKLLAGESQIIKMQPLMFISDNYYTEEAFPANCFITLWQI
jgi:hypothetical protein